MRRVVAVILSLGFLTGLVAYAADPDVQQMRGPSRDQQRKEIQVPDILGMKTLKCDFHIHTVFSDGAVWPTQRMDEAWREGLDAIAITDHVENQPSKTNVGGDHNASYEIALPLAQRYNLILVHGAEITRKPPFGHCNALFIKDANGLDAPDPMKAAEIVASQGGLLQWNHPGGKAAWTDVQDELVKKGWLNGIEVMNGDELYSSALEWCLTKGVAIMGNTDVHRPINDVYDTENGHRTLTLVFARERSEASLREALLAGRTVAWFGDQVIGKKEFLEPLFQESIVTQAVPGDAKDKRRRAIVSNRSDLAYLVESEEAGWKEPVRFAPRSSRLVTVNGDSQSIGVCVTNLSVGPKESLATKLPLPGPK